MQCRSQPFPLARSCTPNGGEATGHTGEPGERVVTSTLLELYFQERPTISCQASFIFIMILLGFY